MTNEEAKKKTCPFAFSSENVHCDGDECMLWRGEHCAIQILMDSIQNLSERGIKNISRKILR